MSTENPDGPRFERRDIKVGPVARLGLGIALLTALVAVAMFGLFRWFKGGAPARTVATPELAAEPRLQTNEPGDLQALLAAQRRRLNSYGWVDRANGVIHIPIDEASRILVERGLPVRAAAPAHPSTAGVPTDSGGVR